MVMQHCLRLRDPLADRPGACLYVCHCPLQSHKNETAQCGGTGGLILDKGPYGDGDALNRSVLNREFPVKDIVLWRILAVRE
jgi:hypothetical protein